MPESRAPPVSSAPVTGSAVGGPPGMSELGAAVAGRCQPSRGVAEAAARRAPPRRPRAPDGPPAWAKRMKHSQTVSHGLSTAAHAVRAGDHGGGNASVVSRRGNRSMFPQAPVRYGKTPEPETPYQKAAQAWDERIGSARVQARNWRLMAFGCLFLAGGFAAALVWQSLRGTVAPWVVQVDTLGEAQAVAPASRRLPADRSADRLAPRALRRECPRRCRPIRSSCGRTGSAPMTSSPTAARWRSTTMRASTTPSRDVGKMQLADRSLQRHPRLGEQFPGRLDRAPLRERPAWPRPSAGPPSSTIVVQPPRDADRLRKNPLGIFVNAINWSKELGLNDAAIRSGFRKSHSGSAASASALAGCVTFKAAGDRLDDVDVPPCCRRSARPVRDRGTAQAPAASGPVERLPWRQAPPEPAEPTARVEPGQCRRARAAGTAGYINAVQVYPFTDGALYQVYAAPGQVTDIAAPGGRAARRLRPGRRRRHRALDHRRHGERRGRNDAASTSWSSRREPTSSTNLVVNTDRRTYLLELRSTEATYMAAVAWQYPEDR